MMRRSTAASLALAIALSSSPALAQGFSQSYSQQTGEALYKGICQGCHMPDAKGASGAGAYPALAGDGRLEARSYPALVVLRGKKAMPSFGTSLTDAQIAEVVTYVRSHFGNTYKDATTPEEIKALRVVAAPKEVSHRAPG